LISPPPCRILLSMSVAQNIIDCQNKIAAACKKAGREAKDVTLVAVSKVQPLERITAALNAGHRTFGENRVQEAYEHWESRRADYPDLRLHLIGSLQTNKAAQAVALFDVIETLDREKLARALAKEMDKQNRRLPCFIQVNTGEEPQKAGISVRDLPDFYDFCTKDCGLEVTGLMCIPPIEDPPGVHFALLAKLAGDLKLENISMGMSADYEKAIELGATHVRIGTGVFGARDYE